MKPSLIFVLVILCSSVYAQFQKFSDQLFFKRFNTSHGLSQASVNCILHDSKGFMWFGTDDGLNRFDGNQFRIFRRKNHDPATLVGNTVHALWEDDSGRIWIGTSEGLSRFDPHVEKFRSFRLKDKEYYGSFDFKYDKKNERLWMASGVDGITYIDLHTDQLHHYKHEQLNDVNVLRIELMDNKLYAGTLETGLLSIDLNTQELQTINLEAPENKSTFHFPIRALLAQQNLLWVGTEGDGLKELNTTDGTVRSYSLQRDELSDSKIWSLAMTDNKLWVGTDGGGLTVLNLLTRRSSFYRHSYYKTKTISSNTIRSIVKDHSGDLWFGTFNGGVNYLPQFNIKFHTFRKDPEDPYSLTHNAILSFCELEDGMLLIGTDGGGLNYLKDGKFHTYKFPHNIEAPTVILSIEKSRTGGILLGTYQQGLYYIAPDKKVTQYTYDPDDPSSISSNIVWDIEEDLQGNVWLSTEMGINRFSMDRQDFKSFRNRKPSDHPEVFNDKFTQTLLIDSTQTLWIGFFGRLQAYNLNTGQIIPYPVDDDVRHQLQNKRILSLHADKKNKNTIWFSAFGSGLVKLDRTTKQFQLISENDGLPNNLIFAIQSDPKGHVWFTTNKGLVQYNPKRKSFYAFEQELGVNTAPFKNNATYRTSSGYLLFGGTNGFTAFWPSKINFEKSNLNVTFTGFQLFNEEVPIDNTILKKSITETTSIKLPYDRAKFISLEFSAPQFLSPSIIQYEYMLEGFEDRWHLLDGKRLTFTNLPPGKYKLRIKAGFSPQSWGPENTLNIHVVPAWWMTAYAYVGVLLMLAGLGYAFYRYRTYRLNQRKAELERIVSEQNLEIRLKNLELATQNTELSQHNAELIAHRNTINRQNTMLYEAQEQLKQVNQSLEVLVHQRTQKLNETITQLNKTIKELDAFVYSASHDLAAPLKSILGLVYLAKREQTGTPTETGMYLDHIEKSVRKLEIVIHTLMQHSFNTKAEARMKPVRLSMLIHEAIAELQFMEESKKIKFQYDLQDAVVYTDTHRLKIILSNLISNAMKYCDPWKEANCVELRFNNDQDTWSLTVTDNGIGIEHDRLERVFDMFYRATANAKGSGLGLYITKDTVERMGGAIEVDSVFGAWTKFTISFPYTLHHAPTHSESPVGVYAIN